MKEYTSCVALLADQVGSRRGDRVAAHQEVLDAIQATNDRVPSLDALRTTVGDELQGVYARLGDAILASHVLRGALVGRVELRFGLGGGDVQIVDAERGIHDGSAWWRAREAIEAIEAIAAEPGYGGLRTGLIDGRTSAGHLTVATIRLVDAQLARLRDGARASLRRLLEGYDNQSAASSEGISPSANSQRINNNDLRVLAAAIEALGQLP